MENMIFKQVEVSGFTKEDAFENAPFTAPIDTWHNATAKYRSFVSKQGTVTASDMKLFMQQFIKDKKMTAGQGAYIILENPSKDTRKRPYAFKDIKGKGSRRYGKVFQIFDRDTKEILAVTKAVEVPMKDKDGNVLKNEEGEVRKKISSETKNDAKKIAAALYTEHGYKGNLAARSVKVDLNGDDIVFEMDYAPSKNTNEGRWLVFGMLGD